jgi:lysozyme
MTIEIPNLPYIYGPDVSVWQDDNSTAQQIDFDKMKSFGASYVGIKVSQSNWIDQDFIFNWNHARQKGLPRIGYHFLDWDVEPTKQAETYYGAIKNDPPEVLAVCDYEKRENHPGKKKAVDYLWNYLETLDDLLNLLNRRPKQSIYTSPSYWKEFGTSDVLWTAYELWLAHYGVTIPSIPKPWTKWTFWQWGTPAWGLSFGAESKDIDMNWFNGQAEDFKKLFGVDPCRPEIAIDNSIELDSSADTSITLENEETEDWRVVTADVLNIRISPIYENSMKRKQLKRGDEVEVLPGGMESKGEKFVPIVLYVAERFLKGVDA